MAHVHAPGNICRWAPSLPQITCRCYKWEQGEIPEAHARFLGLRDGGFEEFSARKKQGAVERSLYTAAAAGGGIGLSSSLRGAEESGDGKQEQRGQGDRFITYWSEKGTDRPVKWVFFNDAYFQVRGNKLAPSEAGGGKDRKRQALRSCLLCLALPYVLEQPWKFPRCGWFRTKVGSEPTLAVTSVLSLQCGRSPSLLGVGGAAWDGCDGLLA